MILYLLVHKMNLKKEMAMLKKTNHDGHPGAGGGKCSKVSSICVILMPLKNLNLRNMIRF